MKRRALCRRSSSQGSPIRSPERRKGMERDPKGPHRRICHEPAPAGRCRIGQDDPRVSGALFCAAPTTRQGALMAPTEVLARQHMENLEKLKSSYDLPIHPVLLTGSVKGKARKTAYEKIASGEADIVIGTHALIQESVEYTDLGLVGHGRTAQIRRPAEGEPCGQRESRARPRHERHADPQNAGHHHVR